MYEDPRQDKKTEKWWSAWTILWDGVSVPTSALCCSLLMQLNTVTNGNLGGNGLICLILSFHSPSLREIREGIQSGKEPRDRTWKLDSQGMLLTSLLTWARVQLLFLYVPGPCSVGWALSHLLWIKKMPHRFTSANLKVGFSQLRLLLPRWFSSLCLWQNTGLTDTSGNLRYNKRKKPEEYVRNNWLYSVILMETFIIYKSEKQNGL